MDNYVNLVLIDQAGKIMLRKGGPNSKRSTNSFELLTSIFQGTSNRFDNLYKLVRSTLGLSKYEFIKNYAFVACIEEVVSCLGVKVKLATFIFSVESSEVKSSEQQYMDDSIKSLVLPLTNLVYRTSSSNHQLGGYEFIAITYDELIMAKESGLVSPFAIEDFDSHSNLYWISVAVNFIMKRGSAFTRSIL